MAVLFFAKLLKLTITPLTQEKITGIICIIPVLCGKKGRFDMRNNRVLILVFAILMLTLSLVSCSEDDLTVPSGCIEISADGVGYNFYMVDTWQIGEQSGMTSAMVSDFDTSNVSMMGFDAGQALSAEEYWTQFSEEFNAVFGEMVYESEGEDTTLGGKNAKKYIYNASIAGKEYKFMQIVCYVTNANLFTSQPEVYVFTYTASPEKYDEHIEDVIYMVDNIVFEE